MTAKPSATSGRVPDSGTETAIPMSLMDTNTLSTPIVPPVIGSATWKFNRQEVPSKSFNVNDVGSRLSLKTVPVESSRVIVLLSKGRPATGLPTMAPILKSTLSVRPPPRSLKTSMTVSYTHLTLPTNREV